MAYVATKPPVSIVIAAASAAETLPAALKAVADQDYDGPIEVIVAAADKATAHAAVADNPMSPEGLKVVDNPVGSTPAGLNLAIEASSGDILVRVDAQSVIPSDYVRRVVEVLTSTGAESVGGRQIPEGVTFLQRTIAASMASRFGAGDARYRVGGPPGATDTVYLGAFTRSTFEKVGGYDERFLRNQDYELNHRIRSSGGTVWLDPSVGVIYRPRSSLVELASQYFQYGTWKRVFLRAYPGSLRPRQWAPPLLVIGLLAALVGSIFSPWAWVAPGAYVLGLAGVAAIHLPKVGPPALLMPAALGVMHISWGVGFLFGQVNDR